MASEAAVKDETEVSNVADNTAAVVWMRLLPTCRAP